MLTRAQSWCSLPGGRCHALLICESPRHPHRAWHRFLVPLRGCQPERRGWAARVAAHVEQALSLGVGLCGGGVPTRGGHWGVAVILNLMGPLPESGQKSSVCQQSGEAPEALQSIMRGALSSFLSPKGLSGLSFLMGGEPWGPASFKNRACFQH